MEKLNVEDIKKKFGANLRSLRKKKKLTQTTLGVKCGTDYSQISQWERGMWDLQLSTIVLLAKGLEIEPKELLDFKL